MMLAMKDAVIVKIGRRNPPTPKRTYIDITATKVAKLTVSATDLGENLDVCARHWPRRPWRKRRTRFFAFIYVYVGIDIKLMITTVSCQCIVSGGVGLFGLPITLTWCCKTHVFEVGAFAFLSLRM